MSESAGVRTVHVFGALTHRTALMIWTYCFDYMQHSSTLTLPSIQLCWLKSALHPHFGATAVIILHRSGMGDVIVLRTGMSI